MHAVRPNAQDGFEVFDLATGAVLTSHNAGQQFAAMSVVKLLIAAHPTVWPKCAARTWRVERGGASIARRQLSRGHLELPS